MVITDYEILIVGGGPAGISTWLHLNKYYPEISKKAILIEKEKFPREKLCGGALGGWTDYVLNDLDIDLDIPTVPINKVLCSFGKEIYEHNEKKFFKIVRRFEFDKLLVNNAKENGMTLSENESFLNLKRKGDNLFVTTNKNCYKTKILIGADGALSNVRKKMISMKKGNLAPALEVFSPVNNKLDPEFENNTVSIDFSPINNGIQGYIWHFPCIYNKKPYMNHGIGDFRLNKIESKNKLNKVFDNALKSRQINIEQKNWNGHPIRWLAINDTISNQNIILVGDAAGIDPAIGGGIHLALSYGDLAAKTISEAYENNDFSFSNYYSNFEEHIVGKYIFKLSYLAKKMYNNEMSPLEASKEIFSKKRK